MSCAARSRKKVLEGVVGDRTLQQTQIRSAGSWTSWWSATNLLPSSGTLQLGVGFPFSRQVIDAQTAMLELRTARD
jgi:hypothetical protein